MGGSDDVSSPLTREANASVSPLYRQRWFALTLPHILSAYNSGDRKSDSKASSSGTGGGNNSGHSVCLLLAVSHLLRHVPRAVLFDTLLQTLPLLIRSLSVPAPTTSSGADAAGSAAVIELWSSTLITLTALVRDYTTTPRATTPAGGSAGSAASGSSAASFSLTTDVGTILPLVLTLAAYRPAMRVRMAAVECLEAISALPYVVLYPHRSTVINGLSGVLDDPKRAVRRVAVRCRNHWFLLTGGGAGR